MSQLKVLRTHCAGWQGQTLCGKPVRHSKMAGPEKPTCVSCARLRSHGHNRPMKRSK